VAVLSFQSPSCAHFRHVVSFPRYCELSPIFPDSVEHLLPVLSYCSPFNTKPEDHFLSAVRAWLFNTVAATLRIWRYMRIIWAKPGPELLCEGTNETKGCNVCYGKKGRGFPVAMCGIVHSNVEQCHCFVKLQSVRFIVSDRD